MSSNLAWVKFRWWLWLIYQLKTGFAIRKSLNFIVDQRQWLTMLIRWSSYTHIHILCKQSIKMVNICDLVNPIHLELTQPGYVEIIHISTFNRIQRFMFKFEHSENCQPNYLIYWLFRWWFGDWWINTVQRHGIVFHHTDYCFIVYCVYLLWNNNHVNANELYINRLSNQCKR